MIFKNPQFPSVADFDNHPVWIEYNLGSYEPAPDLPVSDLESGHVACDLVLANGDMMRGIISGIHLNNPELTNVTARLILIKNGDMFGYRKEILEPHRSSMLQEFLSLSPREIFPIRYDISEIAIGHPDAVRGIISASYPEELENPAARVKFLLEHHKRDFIGHRSTRQE